MGLKHTRLSPLQVVHLAAAAGKASIVWQEAFDQGVPLPPMTRVQVWKWWKEGKQEAGQQGAVDSSSSRSGSDSNGASITLGEAASLEEGGSVASRRRALLQHPPQEGAACSLSTGCGSAVAGEDDAWKAELKVCCSVPHCVCLCVWFCRRHLGR